MRRPLIITMDDLQQILMIGFRSWRGPDVDVLLVGHSVRVHSADLDVAVNAYPGRWDSRDPATSRASYAVLGMTY